MKVVISFLLVFFVVGCAVAPSTRNLAGNKIESKANIIVLASPKKADFFYKELKNRALAKDFYFLRTDADTYSFITEFRDLSKKSSLQIKVYIKNVKGGSNAIISGKYIKLKKRREGQLPRPLKVMESGGGNSPIDQAWSAMHSFAVGSKKWKAKFLRH